MKFELPHSILTTRRRKLAFSIALLSAVLIAASLGAFFVMAHILGSHKFVPDIECAKCHLQQVTEASESVHKVHDATFMTDCARCHGTGKEMHYVTPINCSDCHYKPNLGAHQGMYEQQGETPEDASAVCVSCHASTPVEVTEVKKEKLYYTID